MGKVDAAEICHHIIHMAVPARFAQRNVDGGSGTARGDRGAVKDLSLIHISITAAMGVVTTHTASAVIWCAVPIKA